nr:ribonuclease H-like domain-containing protein [Tanacetum cinerariifolium]
PVAHKFAEQKLARRNELKACGTLLMALPDKHQLKFNSHKDAKTLIEAIEKCFGGNTKTKKVQKTLFKQQFKNFTCSSSENLDQIHDRLLPSEWKTHTLIWRNKADLEEHSLDDLFNSLKIYEAKVKHSFSTGNLTQNLAFMSSSNTDSTTDSVSAATSVSAICAKLSVSSHPNIDSLSNAVIYSFFASQSTSPQLDIEDLKQIDVDDLEEMDLIWHMAMLTIRAIRFLQKTSRNFGDNRVTSMGFDMSKVECYNCHRKGHFARECRSPKDSRRSGATEPQRRTAPVENSTSNALVSQCDGIGCYEWSYQAEEEPANFPLMAITSSSSSSDNKTNEKHGLGYFSLESVCESLSPSSFFDRSQPSGGYHAVPPTITRTFMPPKLDLVFRTAPIDVETGHSAFTVQLNASKPTQDLSHINRPSAPIIQEWVSVLRMNLRPMTHKVFLVLFSPLSKSVDHLIKDCDYHAKNKAQPTPRNYAHRVLTQSKPLSITAVRPVCAAVPKIMVTRQRHAHSINTQYKSLIKRHITHSPSLVTSNSPPRVTGAQALVVSAAKGNMSYLSDFEELNGGYVAFGGNPKGGKISRKGKIKTSKLDFEDVYFVKELKFNLFSVSQMCDKKNQVLFTDTECLVLTPDFKLPDESQALLRVHRENNMYNVNLKNIVHSGDLTCL